MNKLVVKSHRPWQFALAVVSLSMFIAIATWLWLDESHWGMITDRIRNSDSRKLLWEVNQGLEEENVRLRERVLMQEQTQLLDRQTASLLQSEIKALQDEVFRLKGELEFYLDIMDATGGTKGLGIHGVHVQELAENHGYRLQLILTHVTKSDTVAEGTMVVSIDGNRDGESVSYALSELTAADDKAFDFSFRNFKRFESVMVLPEDFVPMKIAVELRSRDGKQANIRRVFDWPASSE